MSEYSKFSGMHDLLSKIPYPGASWDEVITTYPTYKHLHWTFVFAILSALLQLFCYMLTKLFAPYFMGYTSTPPLRKRIKANRSYYIKLAEACNYTSKIDLSKYDFNELSSLYCDNKLSAKEVEKYLKFCNKHHMTKLKNEQRFQECLFPIFTKIFTFGFGLYAFSDKKWLYDGRLFFAGWPNDQKLDCCASDMKLLYIMHIGWYIYKLFGQTVLDRHLKDFIAALTHHITTIVLMSLSYNSGCLRVGVAVLLIHDPSDIILQSAKLCRLIHQTLLMNIGFACLVITWFATRIVIFPYQCIYLSTIDLLQNRNNRPSKVWICGIILMSALYVLHLHWFSLILKAVGRAISGKAAADPRSDSDDSSDESENYNGNSIQQNNNNINVNSTKK